MISLLSSTSRFEQGCYTGVSWFIVSSLKPAELRSSLWISENSSLLSLLRYDIFSLLFQILFKVGEAPLGYLELFEMAVADSYFDCGDYKLPVCNFNYA